MTRALETALADVAAMGEAAPDESRAEAIARWLYEFDSDGKPHRPKWEALQAYEQIGFFNSAKDFIAADPAMQTILELQEKLRALTMVAEDAKALAKAALEREAVLREDIEPIYQAVRTNAAPYIVDYALSQIERIDLDPDLLRDLFRTYLNTDTKEGA